MEILILIAAVTEWPFRLLLTFICLTPVGLLGGLLGWRLSRASKPGAHRSVVLKASFLIVLVWALVMEWQWPMRTGYETRQASKRGEISHARAHQEIDLNGTPEGLLLRGLIFWGPFVLVLGTWLGARVCTRLAGREH